MQKTDKRLVEWAIRTVEEKYPGRVAVMLNHNTYRLEEDRNIHFASHIIADGEPLEELARTVMIGGVGYDFFQQSWESYERDAEAKGYFLTILLDGEIVYCRSEADRQRFLYLREKLKAHLADGDYMYQRGLEWLNSAMELFKNMLFETDLCQIRKAAGYLADYLTVALACLNQTYFKCNTRVEELKEMRHIPKNFLQSFEEMAYLDSVEALRENCYEMICAVRDLFAEMEYGSEQELSSDYAWLAQWYQECSYYFRRVYRACESGDAVQSFENCSWFQADLDDIAARFNIPGLDICTYFHAGDLEGFSQKVRAAEKRIVQEIEGHHVKLDAYDTIDDFLLRNP